MYGIYTNFTSCEQRKTRTLGKKIKSCLFNTIQRPLVHITTNSSSTRKQVLNIHFQMSLNICSRNLVTGILNHCL